MEIKKTFVIEQITILLKIRNGILIKDKIKQKPCNID